MKISSDGIVNGKILDKYGKRGTQQKFGMPTLSLPLKIEDSPKGTASYAIIFDDPDSVPVCGYVWIHWLVANLQKTELKEDESQTSFDFVQGKNSWNDNSYGGPCPPDRPHAYRLRVYALSSKLDLRGDFSLAQLENALEGKVLEVSELTGIYDN